MNKMYFINLESRSILKGRGRYEASSKATEDVRDLVLQETNVGYLPVVRHASNKLCGALEIIVGMYFQLLKIPKRSTIFVQYPIVNIQAYYLFRNLLKKHQTIAIIHDLQSYRYPHFYHVRKKELQILNSMSCLIVHSESMKSQLSEDGITVPMLVLNCFDYLLPDSQQSVCKQGTIMFAGALGKSIFLKDMYKIDWKNFVIHLYGKERPDITYTDNIVYKGAFLPNDISSIEGEWGLLWDGNDINQCDGNFGEYLRLIAPHKLSLYIACGMKIIVWEGSAMASFIKKNQIGITIKNLAEIPNAIASLGKEDVKNMEKQVQVLSMKIRHGMMFKQAFVDAQRML